MSRMNSMALVWITKVTANRSAYIVGAVMADLRVRSASGLRTASAFIEFGALWCGLATGPVMRAAGYMGKS